MKKGTSLAHGAYLAALLIKGFDGAVETIAGVVIALAGSYRLYHLVIRLTAPELELHPRSTALHLVRHGAAGLTHVSTHFVVFYLLVHGVLKLGIAVTLLQGKRWIFPIATVILSGFVLYMSYHLTRHWSWWVLGFALFDLLTVALVVNEWRRPARRGQ